MMFITHFNKLIRNKVLWSIFAGIVVLSFVLWTTQTDGTVQQDTVSRTGKLDGKPVPAQEFQSAYFNSVLAMSLMFGKPLQVTPAIDAALRGMAWRRLASLRAARDLAIPVTGDEVVAAIRQQPFFAANGQYQPDRYAAFVERFLSGLGTSERQFEEYIRQELLLNKVKHLVAQAAWVAPLEVEQVFAQLYDTFVVSYVFLAREDIEPLVTVGADEARSYFEGHRELFKIPDRMRVKWVAFPFEAFLDEGRFDEADLRERYEDEIEQFTERGTNDQLVAKPFDLVEDELRAALALESANDQARDRASDFEIALAPDRQGRAPTFEEAAQAAGLTVVTSGYFSARQAIPGLESHPEFAKAAFDLRRTPDDYFSRPLKGDSAYYLLAVDDRVDARLPEYAEVEADVLAAAKYDAVTEKMEQVARRCYEAARAGVEQGKPLAGALQGTGLEVFTTEPFSVKEGLEVSEFEHFDALVREALKHNSGELTDLVPLKTSGYLFGFVDVRRPAGRTLLESARGDLARYIRNRREDLVFSEWQSYLLASAKFEDLAPARKPAAPESEAEEESFDDDQPLPDED